MGYATIVHRLHLLTKKQAVFQWTAGCEVAFESLESKLVASPVIAYPNFKKDKLMPASKVWEQYFHSTRMMKKLHPVAYASRSVSTAESSYVITNLETLAVVWAVAHFRYLLVWTQLSCHR